MPALNASTTVSLNDIVYGAWIEAAYLEAAWMFIVAQQFGRKFSLVGKPSGSISLPRLDSVMTVGDRGASVATAFDAVEATDLVNTQFTTSTVTGDVSEYALMLTLSDDVNEDSINGFDLLNKIMNEAARVIMSAKEDDFVALFTALDNEVGVTNTDLTIAVAIAAHVDTRRRGFHAPDGMVYILDPEAWNNLEAALLATNAATAVYAAAVDRMLGVDATANHGMGNGHIANFRGYPVYESQFCDLENTAVDVISACFIPSSPGNDSHATFAVIDKRPFRIEPERDASLRGTELVFSERWGAGELNGGAGDAILSDAP